MAIHAGQALNRAALLAMQTRLGQPVPEGEPGIVECTVVYLGWVHEDGSHSESITKAEAKRYLRSPWVGGPYGWVPGDPKAPPKHVCNRVFKGC